MLAEQGAAECHLCSQCQSNSRGHGAGVFCGSATPHQEWPAAIGSRTLMHASWKHPPWILTFPSLKDIRDWDSSMKITPAHCCLVHSRWRRDQARWAAWWAWVRGGQTADHLDHVALMKLAVDGLVTNADTACCPQFNPQYICGSCSVPKACQDNKSVLLPSGGPGPSSVPSLCHTWSWQMSLSLWTTKWFIQDILQLLHCYSITQPCQHPLLFSHLSFSLLFCCPIICADLTDTTPVPLIPASLPLTTPTTDSASWPHPQRSTGGDVRSLVSCHLKETLYNCWVTSVVFSSACSDSTYAGHHLLCPPTDDKVTESDWVSIPPPPPESRPPLRPPTNPPMQTFWCWSLWSELP